MTARILPFPFDARARQILSDERDRCAPVIDREEWIGRKLAERESIRIEADHDGGYYAIGFERRLEWRDLVELARALEAMGVRA